MKHVTMQEKSVCRNNRSQLLLMDTSPATTEGSFAKVFQRQICHLCSFLRLKAEDISYLSSVMVLL